MSRLAILYDSSGGQTEKIVRRVDEIVRASGHDSLVADMRRLPNSFHLDQFDGIIIGASIHGGRHSRFATDFVKNHLQELSNIPSSFYAVSLSAAGQTKLQKQNAQRCLDDFLRQTAWQPRRTATFAGALLYREYGWFMRWIMVSGSWLFLLVDNQQGAGALNQ